MKIKKLKSEQLFSVSCPTCGAPSDNRVNLLELAQETRHI